MKVVHIITRLILGGAQEETLISCKLLAERGIDVILITGPPIGPEGSLLSQTRGQKYKTIIVDKMIRAIDPTKDVIGYIEIKRLLKELRPDIVHTHSAKAGVLGRYAAYNLNPKPKIVHTIHGLAFHPYQSKQLNKFYIAIEKAMAKRTDVFISNAEAITKQALAAGIGRREQYHTVYSALEEDNFLKPINKNKIKEFRQKYEISEDAVVLVTIARLFTLKGHNYIIESAKELSKRFNNVVWLFVGGGNLSDKYKHEVEAIGLTDKIKFTGLISPGQTPGEIPLAMQSSDVLVHCSLREGLARVLPQAMLCGKPAISFDIDGANEVVSPDTGRLVEPENVEQLTEACAELIANENLRLKLGSNGKEFVKEKFSPKVMVDKIEEVYERLL